RFQCFHQHTDGAELHPAIQKLTHRQRLDGAPKRGGRRQHQDFIGSSRDRRATVLSRASSMNGAHRMTAARAIVVRAAAWSILRLWAPGHGGQEGPSVPLRTLLV